MEESPRSGQNGKPARTAVLGAYQLHAKALRRFVARMFNNNRPDDVEDVLQEAFLCAYIAECDKEIEQPKSYLFRVARNLALNQLRQKTRRPTDYIEDFNAAEVLASEWTLEDEIMAQQKLGVHCAAVAGLPPQCRKVYLMRKVYAMSHKEISESLNITVSTVETHLNKGFARCEAYVTAHMHAGIREQQPRKSRGGSDRG